MSSLTPHTQYVHGTAPRVGLLLVNLGTPDAPTAPAVRRYLKEFLSDSRVVEIPKPIWWLILNGIILNTRPAKSAAKYASIWSKDGSPLMVYSQRQASMLRGYLGEAGLDVQVELAMRYGNPSIQSAWDKLIAANCTKILVLPLYPQYAGSTTATAMDAVMRIAQASRNVPELRFVRNYHDDEGYINALRQRVLDFWQTNGRGDYLLMSFHGVPKRTLLQGDPYHCECYKTGRLLAQALGLSEGRWGISFQSRFGKAEWLKPYTSQTLHELPKKGVKALDVVCPGFTSDCLETLEEISMEGKQEFLTAGGQQYHYIPSLNDSDLWIKALSAIAQRHLQGWPVARVTDRQVQADHAAQLQLQANMAKQLGATK